MHHAVDPMLLEDSLHGEPTYRVRGFGIPDFVKDVAGVGKGIVEGAVDTVTGVVDAVTNPVETAEGIGQLFTNPGEAFPAMWDAIKGPIEDDWKQGNQGEAIGRGIFGVAEVIFGAKGLTKLGKAGKAGKATDAVPDAPRPQVRPKPDGGAPSGPDRPGGGGAAAPSRGIDAADPALKALPRVYDAKQMHALRHEFKHAGVFGVHQRLVPNPKKPGQTMPLSPNKAELQSFRAALEAHVASPTTTAFRATYKGEDVVLYLDRATQKAAWFRPNGEFWGAKRINDAVMQRVVDTGVIGT